MSRTVPGPLATRLAAGSSSVFFVVDITRTDGVEHKLSEADVTWNDYEPTAGLQIGTIPYGIDGYSSGVDLVLPVSDSDDAVITPADVRAGAFDAATIVITEADMTLPAAGGVQIFWGKIGNQERTTEGKLKSWSSATLPCALGFSVILDAVLIQRISLTPGQSQPFPTDTP
jgi:hypothetical protein